MDTPHARVVPIRPPVPVSSVQGSLALDLTPRLDPPAAAPPTLSGVAADRWRQVEAFVRRYLTVSVEIACGDRPVTQVLRHSRPDVYADLGRRAQLVAQAAGTAPGHGRGTLAVRPVVVTVRSSLVDAASVEACAHVRYGERSRAVAARFEIIDRRWQCTALEFA